MKDGRDARERLAQQGPVGYRADGVGMLRGPDVQPAGGASALTQGEHQRLAQMACAACHENAQPAAPLSRVFGIQPRSLRWPRISYARSAASTVRALPVTRAAPTLASRGRSVHSPKRLEAYREPP